MLQKRLVLTLLLRDGIFANSRGFSLQSVGNIETIAQYLNYEAIDELVLLNVARGAKRLPAFAADVERVTRQCFVPIVAGGGVRSTEDFALLLRSGADKIAINTAAVEDPELISRAARIYGSQCVVVSIDARRRDRGGWEVSTREGQHPTGQDVTSWAREAERLGAGEILLTSIDRDGAGSGYDLELVREVADAVSIPVIASGGVGSFQHLVDGLTVGGASAVSLANLFHFVGYGGLQKAKLHLEKSGIDVTQALWNFQPGDAITGPRRNS